MKKRSAHVKQATALFLALSCMALSTLGGADGVLEKKAPSTASQSLFFAPVPKAVCGPGSNPETALQGQVTAAMRAAGFQGFSCNLQLIGQVKRQEKAPPGKQQNGGGRQGAPPRKCAPTIQPQLPMRIQH